VRGWSAEDGGGFANQPLSFARKATAVADGKNITKKFIYKISAKYVSMIMMNLP